MRTDAIPSRSRIADLVGGVVGAVIGAILAVNIMILSGVESGYEAGLGEVVEQSSMAGVAVLAALMAGPILGVVVTRWIRRSG